MRMRSYRRTLAAVIVFCAAFGFSIHASADTVGEQHTFFTDAGYDAGHRSSVSATLVYVSEHAYWYLDDTYGETLSYADAAAIGQSIIDTAREFDTNIYPKDTALWGSEPNPGIDNDSRVTILMERLGSTTGGYFDSVNEYPRSTAPKSNQREMITVAVDSIGTDQIKSFLAHEFQHLISFNQKELLNHVSEDVWLNELRSQYSITAAGYNDVFMTSDIRRRLNTFITNSHDSLTEWPNTSVDYSIVTLFGEYLVEHYGVGILQETLHSPQVGIDSINAYLRAHGYAEQFKDVFFDWVVANIKNTTSPDQRYGYTRPELRAISLGSDSFLFMNYPSSASISVTAKPWAMEWDPVLLPAGIPADQHLSVSWNDPRFAVGYLDNSGTVRLLTNPAIIDLSGVRQITFVPINISKTAGFSDKETDASMLLDVSFTTEPVTSVQPITDGTLISRQGSSDVYVITGNYKRYMNPGLLKLYGRSMAEIVIVSQETFDRYPVSNYVRAAGGKKVYAVWPDGTKHWLNITAQQFTVSGRDWNAIFTINDSELNFYKTGGDISQ